MSSQWLQDAQQNHTAEKRSVEDSANAQTPFEDMIWQDGLKLKGGRRGTLAKRMSTRHVYITLLMFYLFY